VDFSRADPHLLDWERMRKSIRDGRPGTAMLAYRDRLNDRQIEAIVSFIRTGIMTGKAEKMRYHSAANGWLDHDRYRDAFPFATGKLALDTPWERLTASQRKGKTLYMQACISCHDRAYVSEMGKPWQAQAVSYPRPIQLNTDPSRVDAISSATPYAKHEKPKPALLEPLSSLQETGRQLFLANCAFCHAADGSGKNWIGSFIEPRPKDLRLLKNAPRLRSMIANGVPGTAMPAWKTVLDDRQMQALLSYIRNKL